MQTDDEARPTAAEAAKEPSLPRRALSPAARRALAEAAERRRQAEDKSQPAPEVSGRDGPDPVRYGDWEVKGIASDF